MRILFLFPLMIVGACQTAPKPAAPATQTWEEFVRTRPDTFIQSYEQSIAAMRQQFVSQGLAREHGTIRAYVDAYLPAGNYTLQATGANASVLRRLRVDNVANNLILYGYRAIQFDKPTQAKRLVAAAAGVFGGPSTGADLAVFAPTVVVADLDRLDDATDGSSAAIYRSIEPLKNAPAKGVQIRISLRGPTAPSPYPPPPAPGEEDFRWLGRVVLFLSPPRSIGGMRQGSGRYAKITQPMRVEGERLTPGYHSDIPETTLTKLRAAIRDQVCAPGFVPVGEAGGTSLAC